MNKSFYFIRRYSSEGSALLVVILATSTLFICCMSVWRSSSFISDMVLKRQEYEQRFRAAEGILNYAIAFCKQNYYEIINLAKNGKNNFELDTGNWTIDACLSYKGKILIKAIDKSITLKAELIDANEYSFVLSCNLVPFEKDKAEGAIRFMVKNWKIN